MWIILTFFENWQVWCEPNDSRIALAALYLWFAVRILANELAFRFRAFRLVAFPITARLFAHGFAFRSRRLLKTPIKFIKFEKFNKKISKFNGFMYLAMRHTVRLSTNRHTFRAIFRFAGLVRTFYLKIHAAGSIFSKTFYWKIVLRNQAFRISRRKPRCGALGRSCGSAGARKRGRKSLFSKRFTRISRK